VAEEIGATAVPLPQYLRERHRRATRIIFAPSRKPGTGANASPPSAEILDIPMDQIERDPDQPARFSSRSRSANSAALDPGRTACYAIAVRPSTTGRTPYVVAVGERRWRAHQINKPAPSGHRRRTEKHHDLRVMQIIKIARLQPSRIARGSIRCRWTSDRARARSPGPCGVPPFVVLEGRHVVGVVSIRSTMPCLSYILIDDLPK